MISSLQPYGIPLPRNESFAQEILAMEAADQEVIQLFLKTRSAADKVFGHQLFAKNANRLKEILSEIGWPLISVYGEDIAKATCLLVQHCDADVPFQERCLQLMYALPDAEILPRERAYLEDRVRVNTGRKQLYGTQVKWLPDGSFDLREIEDPEGVEARRAAVGMETLAEYLKIMKEWVG